MIVQVTREYLSFALSGSINGRINSSHYLNQLRHKSKMTRKLAYRFVRQFKSLKGDSWEIGKRIAR